MGLNKAGLLMVQGGLGDRTEEVRLDLLVLDYISEVIRQKR